MRSAKISLCVLSSIVSIVGAGLLTQIEYNKSLILLVAVSVAFLNWLAVRNRATRPL